MKKYLLLTIIVFQAFLGLSQSQNTRQSLISRVVPSGAKMLGMKKRFNRDWCDESKLNGENEAPLRKFQHKYNISSVVSNKNKVWTLSPKQQISSKYIFYLHGGAYILGMGSRQWSLIGKLIDRLHCSVVVPEYPLAPTHKVDETMAFVLAEYQALVAKVGAENITIMGDSAGGGMSLALAEKLNVVDTPQPAHLILLSPWMDVRMTNPEIIETDKLDPVLGVQGAMCAGIMYAGAHDLKDFEVSPLFGNIKNLAPITLFIGSHDILEPDCRLFKQKAEAENIKLDYRLYKNMVHVWMVISGLPEANQAIDEIVEVLKQ